MRELKPDCKAQLTLENGRCNDELNIRASTCHRVTKPQSACDTVGYVRQKY